MYAFEYIVSKVLEAQGFWTRVGYKVDVSKDQKRFVGKPSRPRPEIDVLAFKPGTNALWLVECKSLLDSYGIDSRCFEQPNSKMGKKFKLFNDRRLFQVVSEALLAQLRREGLLADGESPTVKLVLVAGKFKGNSEGRVRHLFEENEWDLIGPTELSNFIRKLAERGYEDETVILVTKILKEGKRIEDHPLERWPPGARPVPGNWEVH